MLVRLLVVLLSIAGLFGCAHGGEKAETAAKPASTKIRTEREMITGEVVLMPEGYRFRPNEEPDKTYRLSRSDVTNDLVNQELHMRKYYGKTLVVRGRKQEDWLADAAVIGQFLKPGESSGPNTTAPPEPR